MEGIIERYIHGLTGTLDVKELESLTGNALSALGFNSFIFRLRKQSETYQEIFGRFDRDHLIEYHSRGFDKIDPTPRRADASWLPIFWDAREYLNNGDRECSNWYSRSIGVGYECGFVAPIHGPARKQYMLVGIYSTKAKEMKDSKLAVSHQLAILGMHLASAYQTISGTCQRDGNPLTRRENLCLYWTCQGKTAWEVAKIIGIGERTVNFHLENAKLKLGCSSKLSACIKAIDLDLLSMDSFATH